MQEELKQRLDGASALHELPSALCGLDVSYEPGSDHVAAAAVVVDVETYEIKERVIVHGEATFPYIPGLLAFREMPILLEALGKLTVSPQALMCDGYGIAHPRRFGLACHLGVITGIPSFGVAKTPYTATFVAPGMNRGDESPLILDGEVVGRVLRTQRGIKPVFVSVGHRIRLDQACALTLQLSPKFRIPEAIRQADVLSRAALRAVAPRRGLAP